MREDFLSRFDKKSTKDNYLKAFLKFDSYLSNHNQTENEFISLLKTNPIEEKYKILQSVANEIKDNVSPRTVRLYFDCLFKYFLIEGAPLDFTQKRLRIKLPRIINKIYEGLDRESLTKLLSFSSDNFSLYIRSLAGSGMRETEGLRITPSMIKFDETPVRVLLPGEITKFSIPRETFFPTNTAHDLLDTIETKGIKQNETIFIDCWNEDNTLIDFEKYFNSVRAKAGLDTPDREKNQKNDITLHSCRAFFITTFTDKGQHDFGHALAGHSKYFSTYYRKSLKQRQLIYSSIMPGVDF